MFDPIGSYAPHPEGTAHAFGHREDARMVSRLVRQCYRDWLEMGEAVAFHTAKRLYEQLTGSIDQAAVRRAIDPAFRSGPVYGRKLPSYLLEDDARFGMIDQPLPTF